MLKDFKAIFLDYTGTMVREDDPDTQKLVEIFMTNSNFKDPGTAVSTIWALIKKIEWECYLDSFIKKDEMVERILDICEKEYGFTGDRKLTHDVWRSSWIHAPLFDDVKSFFDKYGDKIYVVTNDDLKYVEESMKEKGLCPAGIVSAEAVNACKPRKEILQEALRISKAEPDEAVMIGDSYTSDVKCAKEVGIVPMLLDRKKTALYEDVRIIHSLAEI